MEGEGKKQKSKEETLQFLRKVEQNGIAEICERLESKEKRKESWPKGSPQLW